MDMIDLESSHSTLRGNYSNEKRAPYEGLSMRNIRWRCHHICRNAQMNPVGYSLLPEGKELREITVNGRPVSNTCAHRNNIHCLSPLCRMTVNHHDDRSYVLAFINTRVTDKLGVQYLLRIYTSPPRHSSKCRVSSG